MLRTAHESGPGPSRFFTGVKPPLDRAQEAALAAADGEQARAALVHANLSYVVSVAKEYRHYGVPFEDLLGHGSVGLVEAARRFDWSKGVKFITYARFWIRREIVRALGEHRFVVTVPDHRRRELRLVRREREALEHRAGRKLDWDELSALTSRSPREIERIREAEAAQEVPLDAPAPHGTRPLSERLAAEGRRSVEDDVIRGQLVERLHLALAGLSQRERRIVCARYGLDAGPGLTLLELGVREGVSRERVRQIERESMARLRQLMQKGWHPADTRSSQNVRGFVAKAESIRPAMKAGRKPSFRSGPVPEASASLDTASTNGAFRGSGAEGPDRISEHTLACPPTGRRNTES